MTDGERVHNVLAMGTPGRVASRTARTSRLERLALVAAVALVPFQNSASVAGVPGTLLVFGFIGLAVMLRHFESLYRVANSHAVVPLYVLVAVSLFAELSHPNLAWDEQRRLAVMIIEAMTIAAVCRDRGALLTILRAIIAAASALAFVFVSTSYGPLRSTAADTFSQISTLRAQVITRSPLAIDINPFAFIMAMGAAVALAFSFGTRKRRQRNLYRAAVVLCTAGVIFSLSRGGVLIEALAVFAVILGRRRHRARTLVTLAVAALGAFAVLPHSVFLRLSTKDLTSSRTSQLTSRQGLFHSSISNVRAYGIGGVGQGNFWSVWGAQHGFQDEVGPVFGAHNTFFQIWMYWGILGLGALLWICWSIYRGLPREGDPTIVLALRAVAVATFVFLFFTHNFYRAEFAVVLGVLLAAQIWHPERAR